MCSARCMYCFTQPGGLQWEELRLRALLQYSLLGGCAKNVFFLIPHLLIVLDYVLSLPIHREMKSRSSFFQGFIFYFF